MSCESERRSMYVPKMDHYSTGRACRVSKQHMAMWPLQPGENDHGKVVALYMPLDCSSSEANRYCVLQDKHRSFTRYSNVAESAVVAVSKLCFVGFSKKHKHRTRGRLPLVMIAQ